MGDSEYKEQNLQLYSEKYMKDYEYSNGYGYEYSGYYGNEETEIKEKINIFSLYIHPLLLLVGLIANVLVVIVMVNLGQKVLSSCFYLALLALVDMFLLCQRGSIWLSTVIDRDLSQAIMTHSEVCCQLYSFACSLVLHMAVWLLTTLMIEICFVIRRPGDVKKLCTAERAKNVILLVLLLLICLNAHFFWTYGVVDLPLPFGESEAEKLCTFSPHGSYYNDYFRRVVWPLMEALGSTFVPNLAIMICVCFIVASMCLKRKRMHLAGLVAAETHETTYDIRDGRTLRGFIVVCAILGIGALVLFLPSSAYSIYESVLEYMRDKMGFDGDQPDSIRKRRLAQAVTYACRDAFQGCKLFIYLAFWKVFRARLRKVMMCENLRVWVRKRTGRYDSRTFQEVTNRPQRAALRFKKLRGLS